MDRHSQPRGAFISGTALAVGLSQLVPLLVVPLTLPEARSSTAIAMTSGIVTCMALLMSSVVVYFAWRLTGQNHHAWISAAAAVIGLHGLSATALAFGEDPERHQHPWYLLGSDLLVAGLCLAVPLMGRRMRMRMNPAAVGLGLGVLASQGYVAVARFGPQTAASPAFHGFVTVLLVAMGLGAAVVILRSRGISLRLRVQLALATLLLIASRAIWSPVRGTFSDVVAIACGYAGAVVLTCLALETMRAAIRAEVRALAELRGQVATVRAAASRQEERLHEVRGTVAGIASASQLIHSPGIRDSSRRKLEELLDHESARLQRLVDPTPEVEEAIAEAAAADDLQDPASESLEEESPDEPPLTPRELVRTPLDDVLRPLILARRLRGCKVRWIPNGRVALTDPDALSTAVNVLLDNAVRHAPGAVVSVCVEDDAERVRIVVRDNGPGVDPSVRDSLFARGRRGTASSGSGIGLHMARRVVDPFGGSLYLLSTGSDGTAFAIDLLPDDRRAPAPPAEECGGGRPRVPINRPVGLGRLQGA